MIMGPKLVFLSYAQRLVFRILPPVGSTIVETAQKKPAKIWNISADEGADRIVLSTRRNRLPIAFEPALGSGALGPVGEGSLTSYSF